jgi:phage repressor protein C with HTH and peptisase S24 domain
MRSPRSFGRPKKRNTAGKSGGTSWRNTTARRKQFLIRQVQGDSMAPTLRAGQIVVGRQTRELKPGDVVIVLFRSLEKIKRIERQQGDLIYLLGDNPAASTDSRSFGWVQAKTIVAKIIWPQL